MKRAVIWIAADWTPFRIACIPAPRQRAVWAGFTRGQHATFKRTEKGRQRSAERQFVRGL